MVSLFIPTGIRIRCKDSKYFRVSVLKRKEIIALIEDQIKKQA